MSDHANQPEYNTGRDNQPPAPEEAKAKRELRIMIIMIVLAVLMVIAAAAVWLYNRWFRRPTLPPGPAQSAGEPAAESGEVPPDLDEIQPKVSGNRKSKDIFTILVFGSDVVSSLTDTMMVVTYDVTNQQAAVMSMPRDTLINVSRSYKQLNGVYNAYEDSAQGVVALKSEVSELVGFVPDFYVKIDWELVGEMVDAIGGVWFDVPYNMQYDAPDQNLHIHFEPGMQFLNGEDAMNMVRWRHNGKDANGKTIPGGGDGSDLTRIQVQHAFLKAVLKQTLQIQNVTKITQLTDLFSRRVESDLAVEEILWFGKSAILGGLDVDDVDFFTMPNIGVTQGRYQYRVYPNQEELLKIINERLNPFVDEVTLNELDLISVSRDGNTLYSSTGVLAGSR